MLLHRQYKLSGGGKGQIVSEKHGFQCKRDDTPLIFANNYYSNALRTYKTHILYFVKHVAVHGIVAKAAQQLNKSHRLGANGVPNAKAKKSAMAMQERCSHR